MKIKNNKKPKTIYKKNPYKIGRILSSKKIPSGTKLVLYYLLGRLGGKSFCWPSQVRIAKDLGLSERQVRSHIKTLKQHGVVEIQKGGISPKGVIFNSNKYDFSKILHKTERSSK